MTKRPKGLNVFIDTNILLGFYRFTEDDLIKLNQLEDLIVKTKDIILYTTKQQVDEFYRNRDSVIAQGLKEIKAEIIIPKLFSGHAKYKDISKKARELRSEIHQLTDETREDSINNRLAADAIIKRLLEKAVQTTPGALKLARYRMAIGNPPGKNGSLGDAINWEMLKELVPQNEDLHIISQDKDYASGLDNNLMDGFLTNEWLEDKNSEVKLYTSLNRFFSAHFTHIKLMDEYIKDELTKQLGEALSFDSARKIIKQLRSIGGLSPEQARLVHDASISNDQVWGAHIYSPSIVGPPLMELLKPHWDILTEDEKTFWIGRFPEPELKLEPEPEQTK